MNAFLDIFNPKMEVVLEVLECYGLHELSMDDCQDIFERPTNHTDKISGISSDQVHNVVDFVNDIEDATALEKTHARQAVALLLLVLSSGGGVDVHMKAAAGKALMRIITLPGASANGILNLSTRLMLIKCFSGIVEHEIKATKSTFRVEEQIDGDDDEGVDDEDDDEDGDDDESNYNEKIIRTKGVRLDELKKNVQTFAGYFCQYSEVFLDSSEEYCRDSYIDTIAATLFLSQLKAEYKALGPMCREALHSIGCTRAETMLSVYRSLIPALTVAGRDSRIPDSLKARTACLAASIDVLELFAASGPAVALQWLKENPSTEVDIEEEPDDDMVVAKRQTRSSLATSDDTEVDNQNENNDQDPEDVHDDSGDETPSKRSSAEASKPSSKKLHMPYNCLVGAIQRMVVGAPDRAQTRQIVCNSIVRLLKTLFSTAAVVEADTRVAGGVEAASHCIRFFVKLLKCSRVSFRAFSLDIITAILNTLWIWRAEDGDAEDLLRRDATMLVTGVMDRAEDVAPTVRIRAVGALGDLVESLNEFSPAMKCQILLSMALGLEGHLPRVSIGSNTSLEMITSPDNEKNGSNFGKSPAPASTAAPVSKNLLDVLRARIGDEKPLVRAKAMQSLGVALTQSWPKHEEKADLESFASVVGEPHDSASSVSMFVSEEDISLLVIRCTDPSLSVRKQAVSVLSALVCNRSTDVMLQEAWTSAVLPAVTDSEGSVQSKVASSVVDVILRPIVEMSKSLGPRSRAAQDKDIAGSLSESALSAWRLLKRIADADQTKLLATCVSILFKAGTLRADGRSTEEKISAVDLMSAARAVCCSNIDISTVSAAQDVVSMRGVDVECLSTSGWVLIESLVGPQASAGAATATEQSSDAGSADFVVSCFVAKRQTATRGNLDINDTRMLKVFEKLVHRVTEADILKMKSILLNLLQQLTVQAEGIAAAVSALHATIRVQAFNKYTNGSVSMSAHEPTVEEMKYVHQDVHTWASTLLMISAQTLNEYLMKQSGGDSMPQMSQTMNKQPSPGILERLSDENDIKECIKAALFTIGEVSMIGFKVEEDDTPSASLSMTRGKDNASFWPGYTVSEISKAFKIVIPESVLTLVQLCMSRCLPETTSASPGDVRAHAFIAMGKLCLRDKARARQHVNVFLREVSTKAIIDSADVNAVDSTVLRSVDANMTTDSVSTAENAAAVRSNALLVLGDLCVRYTHLVDRHVGHMAVCLQDENIAVRKHALILLTQLLLQDFLKWRGMLLFRFLATAIDDDYETAEFSRTVLKKTILSRYPDFFCQHFTEAVIVFNEWNDHPAYLAAQSSGSDGDSCAVTMEGIQLSGANRRNARFKLYNFLMEDFTEEQKIHVTAKLVDDVLSYAIDSNSIQVAQLERQREDAKQGRQSLGQDKQKEAASTSPIEAVLDDSFLILRSPMLKIAKKAGQENGDDADEVEEEEGVRGSQKAAVAKARSLVLKKLSKQHLVSHVMPVIISLKHSLEKNNSPLQGALMELLVSLMKTHPSEIEQVLSNDPSLRAEVEYDMKMYERKKEKERARLADSGGASGPTNQARRTSFAPQSSLKAPLTATASRSVRKSFGGFDTASKQSLPSLRKSFGGAPGSTRTPSQALGSLRRTREEAPDGLADRLVGSDDPKADQENDGDACTASTANIRRRSWAVCFEGLNDDAADGTTNASAPVKGATNANESSPVSVTAKSPKKKRTRGRGRANQPAKAVEAL